MKGFTLIEMVLAMLLIAIIATLSRSYLLQSTDSLRFEQARQQLDTIRKAIIGDLSANEQGHRTNFGYVGDWGSLPGSLSNLSTSQAPSWAFNDTYGFGAGWHGSYVGTQFSGAASVSQDPWGTALVYSTVGGTATITSYGADRAPGGTSYNSDLTVAIGPDQWQSTVNGFVLDGRRAVSGATVDLRYPVAGVITAHTTTTAADGSFSFSSVPFGARSIAVTSSPTLGPKQIIVESTKYQIPNDILNYLGVASTVSLVAGSRNTGGSGNAVAFGIFSSSYRVPLKVSQITFTLSNPNAYLFQFIVNGVVQSFTTPFPASGSTLTVNASQMVLPNNANNIFQMVFSNSQNAYGTANVSAETITLTLNYFNSSNTDTISF